MEVLYHFTGILSVIIFMIGIHFKSNRKLKKFMIANSLIKGTNMFLNQQYVGMFINIINFLRNILSLKIENTEKLKHFITFVIISLYVLIQFFVTDNYWYLPVLGSSFGLFALIYLKSEYMRYCLFLGSTTWLIYALLHQNIYGVILGVATICSFISSFFINKFNYQN